MEGRNKEKIWTTYYRCQVISIERGAIGHGAFFKQRPKSNNVFFEIFDGAKRIEVHKGGNTKPTAMKKIYVLEKSLHEIIILFWQVFIRLNKYGVKRWIHVGSVKRIIYQQCISKVNIKILKEKIRKVLMINCFITSGMINTIIVSFEKKL
jgi:hypothetical protein